MKLYLAGPMTGIAHHNTPAFDAAAAQLRALGHDVVSPPDITRANPQTGVHSDGSIDRASYRELVRLDLIGLLDCSAVVVLPGWSRSGGCKLELTVALALDFPVFALLDLLDPAAVTHHQLKLAGVATLLGPGLAEDAPPAKPFSVERADSDVLVES